ncbi:CG8370, partial [Drosophila busckii]
RPNKYNRRMYTKTLPLPALLLLLSLLQPLPLVFAGLQKDFISVEQTPTFAETQQAHQNEQLKLMQYLNFVPAAIDFGIWSVGQTVTHTVTLFNQHTNRSVQLNAVTGPSPIFYSSFLGTREVPPQGNTTFSVVFLPRQIGAISTGLLIQTSFGRAEIEVRGEGSECPYRLKPLVGIKAPMNATLTPVIHMYNPHARPLQILEVSRQYFFLIKKNSFCVFNFQIYSSGGEFQLELPSGGSEGPQNLWQIPPHSLKPVIRLSFHGRTAGNHSAYIRIKIAEQTVSDVDEDGDTILQLHNEHVLVIPVEFEILPNHGVYARNPLADFGRLATEPPHGETLRFKLELQNAHRIKFLLNNHAIPGVTYDTQNASIVIDPTYYEQSTSINELMLLHTASGMQSFTVLVRAEIYKGGLGWDKNATRFITTEEAAELTLPRELSLQNHFELPLLVLNYSLSADLDPALLELRLIDELPLLLLPGAKLPYLQLRLLDPHAYFDAKLRIATNVSVFELPLAACNGRLHVTTQPFDLDLQRDLSAYKLELDLGTVPFAESSHDGHIILRNDNPLPIKLTNWNFKLPKGVYFQTTFLGCVSNVSVLLENDTSMHICGQLEPGDLAVFRLSIQSYVAEQSAGVLKVWTPYELIRASVRFRASVGQLDIEQQQLQFKSCFPGKVCSAVLSIRSSFTHTVHVKSVSFTRVGLRFKDFNAKGTTIAPQTLTKVGRIYFEPSALCGSTCYIRPGFDERAIFPSLAVGARPNNNLLYDGVEVRQRTELYRKLKRQLQSLSLTLHSDELPPMELDFAIALEWPKLVQHQPLPPTPAIEVGQVQRQWITIKNPSNHPLLLDYYLSDPAYAKRTQLSLPHEIIDVSSSSCYLTDKPVFSLPDQVFTKPMLLEPHGTVTIPVQFSAYQPDKYCTLLHVRSNLTLYEAVWLTARSVLSQFRLGNRRPGSSMPLLFDFDAEQFERCDGTWPAVPDDDSSHTVVTRRSFTARNAGILPLRVDGFIIGRRPCESHGFRVLDCHSFELQENETRKIEISYSADFTASRVQRTLTLLTNLSYEVQYTLLAQLPAESVERCAASLPRPTWEPSLRNAALVVLLVSFCLVLLAAVFDARAILAQQNAYDAARYKAAVQPTFNLRNIVKQQVAEEQAAAAAALKAEQQAQKLRNSQLKDLRKRTTLQSTRKAKTAWAPWSMETTMPVATTQLTTTPLTTATLTTTLSTTTTLTTTALITTPGTATTLTPAKPVSSPKPSKKLQTTPPNVTRREVKKVKSSPPVAVAISKPKVEATPPPELPEKRKRALPKTQISPPQQENVIARTPKFTPEPSKERVLKEQNGSAKKLGKTPGRERRKEPKPCTSKKPNTLERKPRSKQLNFNVLTLDESAAATPLTPELECNDMITSPWETSSRVSFSDVLQTKTTQPAVEQTMNGYQWQTSGDLDLDLDLASTQLGPIGSRKNWQTMTQNETHTDTLFAAPTTPPKATSDLPMPGLNGDLFEHQQQQTRAQWEHQEVMRKQQLLLDQMEQQRNQQQQQTKISELLANMEQSNWSTNTVSSSNNAWSPLGYTGWSATQPETRNSPVRAPGNAIRPPPGLEANCNGLATSTNGYHIDLLNAQEELPMAPPTQYDPFTSPSSIWSDTWRQNNNYMN